MFVTEYRLDLREISIARVCGIAQIRKGREWRKRGEKEKNKINILSP
jgi:hypothetical protein